MFLFPPPPDKPISFFCYRKMEFYIVLIIIYTYIYLLYLY